MFRPLNILKKYQFLLFIICFSAQSQKSSSLVKTIIDESPKLFNNPDSGIVVAQQWFSAAINSNDTKSQILSLIKQSELHHQKCEFEKASKKLEQAILIANSTKNNELILKVYLAKSEFLFGSIQKNIAFDNHVLIKKLGKTTRNSVDYYNYFGNYYYNTSDSAMMYYKRSLESAKKASITESLITSYINIGKFLIYKKSLYPEAQRYLDSALAICNQNDYQKYKALALFYFANSLLKESRYDQCLSKHIEALKIRNRIKCFSELPFSYNSIANLFAKLDKMNDALHYYKQGVVVSEKYNNPIQLPLIYQNIGAGFNNLNNDSAKFYLQKGIEAANRNNDFHAMAYAVYNLADINSTQGNYKIARAGMINALRIFEKIAETSNVGWVLPAIVQLDLDYFEKQKIKINQTQYNENEAMLKKALALNANGNNYETLRTIYNSYVRLGRLTNNYRLISENQSKLLALKDTVFKQQNLKISIEMAEKLKSAEQKAIISELELKNIKSASQRNLAFIGFAGLLILGFIITIFYIKNLRRKNELGLIQQQETFRNQVSSDLHDDVGSILSGLAMQAEIVSITSTNKEQKKSLSEISTMSREAMETMRDIVWAIDSRKDKFENLIDKMRVFAEKNLNLRNIKHSFSIKIDDTKRFISPELRQNIYLIFKEAITNICKHSNATDVKIEFSEQNKQLKLVVQDNGTATEIIKSEGTGLNNMKMRANKIGANLQIESNEGFKTTLLCAHS